MGMTVAGEMGEHNSTRKGGVVGGRSPRERSCEYARLIFAKKTEG